MLLYASIMLSYYIFGYNLSKHFLGVMITYTMWCNMLPLWVCKTHYSYILIGCPVALSKKLIKFHIGWLLEFLVIYADLPDFRANMSPQVIISSSLMITPYCPDIVTDSESCTTWNWLVLWMPFRILNLLDTANDLKNQLLSSNRSLRNLITL